MPVPKRWFPVSREINGDAEVWQLTALYGDRALRVWLEILAGADKTTNQILISGLWLSSLAQLTRMNLKSVVQIVVWMLDRGWIAVEGDGADRYMAALRALCEDWPKTRRKLSEDLPEIPRRFVGDGICKDSTLYLVTRNYWKYHKRPEPKGAVNGSLPSRSVPSDPKKKEEKILLSTSSASETRTRMNGTRTTVPSSADDRLAIEQFTGPLT